jgi:hypothetical protein
MDVVIVIPTRISIRVNQRGKEYLSILFFKKDMSNKLSWKRSYFVESWGFPKRLRPETKNKIKTIKEIVLLYRIIYYKKYLQRSQDTSYKTQKNSK